MFERICAMSKEVTSVESLAFLPHAIELHWDNVWARRLAGFPVNIVYGTRIEGAGRAYATYVFDPGTFVENERSRQMRYCSSIESRTQSVFERYAIVLSETSTMRFASLKQAR
jgi:hypothetical protein